MNFSVFICKFNIDSPESCLMWGDWISYNLPTYSVYIRTSERQEASCQLGFYGRKRKSFEELKTWCDCITDNKLVIISYRYLFDFFWEIVTTSLPNLIVIKVVVLATAIRKCGSSSVKSQFIRPTEHTSAVGELSKQNSPRNSPKEEVPI